MKVDILERQEDYRERRNCQSDLSVGYGEVFQISRGGL